MGIGSYTDYDETILGKTQHQYWGAYAGFDRRVRERSAKPLPFSPSQVLHGLRQSFAQMKLALRPSPNFFFITAFNEWNEQAVLEPDDTYGHGMLRALEAAGRAGKVRFVGFDSSGTLLEGLRAGYIDALVLQDPVHMGDTAVRTLVGHLDGQDVAARVDTGVTVATRTNLSAPEIAGLLEPDLSILDGR